MENTSNLKNTSKSYIIIECEEDAIPKYNKLNLRTLPFTYIKLQPGENILTVEEYPDLKYGFYPADNDELDNDELDDDELDDDELDNDELDDDELDDDEVDDACPYEHGCGGVIRVDLSHFDPSEMTNMDYMFSEMVNLSKIEFGNIQIKNVTSMSGTFEGVGSDPYSMEVLNLTCIDFSQVENAEHLLYGSNIAKTIDLSGCDLSNVKYAEFIFHCCGIKYLILDEAKLSDEVIDTMKWGWGWGWADLEEISLKGCDVKMIESLIAAILYGRSKTWEPIKVILDRGLDYKVVENEDGTYKVQIIHLNKVNPKHHSMNNTFDLFREECASLKATPNAIEFCKTNNLFLFSPEKKEVEKKDGEEKDIKIKDIFEGLQLDPSISEIIENAKYKARSSKPLNFFMNHLLSGNLDEIVSTTEVFLVTDNDCGKKMSVFNSNWLYLPPNLQAEKSFIEECVIPYKPKPKKKEEDENFGRGYLLGCYLPKFKIIFLWVDRIHKEAKNCGLDINLLFQKVLLHEMIHSLLDCNLRDEDLDVYNVEQFKSIEETITNNLMLKVYFDTDKTKYREILKFVKRQFLEYSSAAMVCHLIQETESWKDFENILANYFRKKATGNSGLKNEILFYSVVGNEDDEDDEEMKKDWHKFWFEYYLMDIFHITKEEYDKVWANLMTEDFEQNSDKISSHFSNEEICQYFGSFIKINNQFFHLKRITLFYDTSNDKKIYKVYFTFFNNENSSLYVATYDAGLNKFEFPLSEGNNVDIRFCSRGAAKSFHERIMHPYLADIRGNAEDELTQYFPSND